MKIVDRLKPQLTRKGDVGDWDYNDLQSIIEVDVNTWDDHNNYAQMLINTSIIYKYLHQFINSLTYVQ